MSLLNDVDRRDFLKLAGFSLAAVACQRPLAEKSVPYLTAPEEIVPGRSYSLASTCHGCPARCGILVKCRDGRPIKIEGNPDHPLSRGGVCAVGQAMVLGLYDSLRLGGPMLGGKPSDWTRVDAFVASKLATAKRVRVVSSTLPSPTLQRTISAFLSRFEDGKHVVYDVPSCSAIADAHAQTHGVRAIPHYRFDKADVVVSVDADFLGTWISPVEFTKQWSARKPKLIQYEGRMSLTGSNADQRIAIDPRSIHEVLGRITERALVVCGSSRIEDQILTNEINERFGNYGTTIDLAAPSYQRQGSDVDAADLLSADALFVLACNPVYDLGVDLARVPFVAAFSSHIDETSRHAHVVAPDHHPLESWDDSEPVAGVYSVTQPAIAPLRNTRAAVESFAAWSGNPDSAYKLIKSSFSGDWEKTLNDGHAPLVIPSVARDLGGRVARRPPPRSLPFASAQGRDDMVLILYPSIAMLDGRHAHNAWLHELPDPITKLTWDNVASISPNTAKKLNIEDGDVVKINGVELPAHIQQGQHDNVVAVAMGYGRLGTDRFAKIGPKWLLGRTYLTPGETVGKRVIATNDPITIVKTGRKVPLAKTQLHDSLEGRDLGEKRENAPTLYPAKPKGAHRWAMAIDLDKCTGCAACVVACQVENNVPVVGKDEVVREREMHWIRIDRYYEGDRVVHQPMMCAHCGNAPCESVCPVLATVHSSDGLNQQVYNRCVGTRYCANNCPFKVRRFNWFDYPHDDRFANLVLNPEVAVRTRGVMEKCSMCVQRIEEQRIVAKQRGTPIPDGAIRMACEQSCPADAIVFGDLNDPRSRISAARRDPRHYRLLEELNIDPAVGYLKSRAAVPAAVAAASRRRGEPV
jgi:Fe-S-cluster-containing dehydrogenase component